MAILALVIINLLTLLALLVVLNKYGLINKLSDRYFPALNTCKRQNIDPASNPYFKDRTELFSSYEVPPNCTILIGDSHIHRANWDELLPAPVLNRGISSDTTAGVLLRIPSITRLVPSHCVVMIGINDILNGETSDDIVNRYRSILDSLNVNGSKLTACSILQVGKTKLGSKLLNQKIADINTRLKKVASKQEITFLDLSPSLCPEYVLNERFTNDGVHLNGKGYVVFASELEKQLS